MDRIWEQIGRSREKRNSNQHILCEENHVFLIKGKIVCKESCKHTAGIILNVEKLEANLLFDNLIA